MFKLLTAFLFLYCSICTSMAQQNLVPDPGFELTRSFNYSISQISYPPDKNSLYWTNLPNNILNLSLDGIRRTSVLNTNNPQAPNYIDYLGSILSPVIIKPRNQLGAAQLKHITSPQIGFYVNNALPYVFTGLTEPLKKDHYYYVEYYVKPSYCRFLTSNIDLYFSTDTVYYKYVAADDSYYLPVVPQIKNPETRFITDTLEWTRICGIYKAKGNERYITIGNFKFKADTLYNPMPNAREIYMIDDVTVTALQFPSDTTLCASDFPFTLEASSSYNPYFSYQTELANNFTIETPGHYTYTIGNEACSAEASIHVYADTSFSFELRDTIICHATLPFLAQAPASLNSYDLQWYNNSNNEQVAISTPGKYWLNITNSCVSLTDTFFLALNYPPNVNITEEEVELCVNDTLLQPVNLSAVVLNYEHMQWNTGEQNSNITLTEVGTYTLQATNSCGISSDQVIAKGCPPDKRFTVYVPNLVTPNSDGKNDSWQVKLQNVKLQNLEIYDRLGKRIIQLSKPNETWGCNVSMENINDGIYFFLLNYLKPVSNEQVIEKGWLQVIR